MGITLSPDDEGVAPPADSETISASESESSPSNLDTPANARSSQGSSPFRVGDILQLNQNDLCKYVKLTAIEFNHDLVPVYVAKDAQGVEYRVSREFLKRFYPEDIANIPVDNSDFDDIATFLSKEDLAELFTKVA